MKIKKWIELLKLLLGVLLLLALALFSIAGPLSSFMDLSSGNSEEYTSSYVNSKDNIQVYALSDDKEQALKEIEQDKVTTTEKDKQLEEEGGKV